MKFETWKKARQSYNEYINIAKMIGISKNKNYSHQWQQLLANEFDFEDEPK